MRGPRPADRLVQGPVREHALGAAAAVGSRTVPLRLTCTTGRSPGHIARVESEAGEEEAGGDVGAGLDRVAGVEAAHPGDQGDQARGPQQRREHQPRPEVALQRQLPGAAEDERQRDQDQHRPDEEAGVDLDRLQRVAGEVEEGGSPPPGEGGAQQPDQQQRRAEAGDVACQPHAPVRHVGLAQLSFLWRRRFHVRKLPLPRAFAIGVLPLDFQPELRSRQILGLGNLLRRAALAAFLPAAPGAAVAALMLAGAADRKQHGRSLRAVDDLPPHLRPDPRQLALAERPFLLLEDQRQSPPAPGRPPPGAHGGGCAPAAAVAA